MDSHKATYFSHFDEIQTALNIRIEDSEMSDSDPRLSMYSSGARFVVLASLVYDPDVCRHTNTW